MTKNLMITLMFSSMMLGMAACGDDDGGTNQNDNQNNNNTTNPICGNGILEPGEVCDDGPNNSDAAPNACRTNCREPHCGDGVVDTGETCDGSNLAANSCVGLGYTKGTLSCGTDCLYDVRDCTTCGDGVAEGTNTVSVGYETCDGSDLREQTCISIGQANGTLACTASCGWNIEGCTGGGPICGNNIIEGNEVCDDGNQVNGDGCSSDCLSDESCGNGIVDVIKGEECDCGTDPNNLPYGCVGVNANEPDACRPGCTLPALYDAITDPSYGEECDTNGLQPADPSYQASFGGHTCSDFSNFNHGFLLCVFPTSGLVRAQIYTAYCSVCGNGVCSDLYYSGIGFVEDHQNCPADCP